MPQVRPCFLDKSLGLWFLRSIMVAGYMWLQDEVLLASWKQQLDKDAETLKMKGNLNHLRTVSISSIIGCSLQLLSSIFLYSIADERKPE